MVEQEKLLHMTKYEHIAHGEASTTFTNMLAGYGEKRVGSAVVFRCLRDVVKTASVYGMDTSDVLATNAKRIQDAANEKKDPLVAREAMVLIDLEKAHKKYTQNESTISYAQAKEKYETATGKYSSQEVGSNAVVKTLVDVLAAGIHIREKSDGFIKELQAKAQEKGDIGLARECNVLEAFSPLLAARARIRSKSELVAA